MSPETWMNTGLQSSGKGEHKHLDLRRIMDLWDASLSFLFIFALCSLPSLSLNGSTVYNSFVHSLYQNQLVLYSRTYLISLTEILNPLTNITPSLFYLFPWTIILRDEPFWGNPNSPKGSHLWHLIFRKVGRVLPQMIADAPLCLQLVWKPLVLLLPSHLIWT